ncbi:hypothetical protein ACHAXA_007007 [Cyclostephanos tholiformis]|uniref:Transmembrane protein n=1 Tax=Cyclostephanos tholiformis TaxID=382380 RepID=A0ABD3RAK1_9STRA
MEYDRALYRVYERIMEDLNSSPSPLQLTTVIAPSFSLATVTSVSPLSSTMTNDAVVVSSALASHRGRSRGLRNRHNMEEMGGFSANTSPDSADDVVASDDDSNEDELGGLNRGQGSDDDIDGSGNHDDYNFNRRGRRGEMQGRTAGIILAARESRQLSTTVSTRETLHHRQRWRQHQPLPFLLPIWMARKIDQIVQNYRDYRYHRHHILSTEDSNSNWSICRALARLGLGNGLYDRVATSPASAATTRQYSALHRRHRSLTSSSPGRDNSFDGRNLMLSSYRSSSGDDDDVEGGRLRPPSLDTTNSEDANGFHHRSPSSSSSDGLRRRSPTRRRGGGGLGVHEGAGTASLPPSIPHLQGSLPRVQFMNPRVGERDSSSPPSPNNIASDTISANGGSGIGNGDDPDNDDLDNRSSSSSEDNDSDDDNTNSGPSDDSDNDRRPSSNNISRYHVNDLERGGCSQLNIYRAMRLSLMIGIIHIMVLISLHATYVGPHAFRGGEYELRQQEWQSHRRWRQQRTHRGPIDEDGIAATSEIDQYEKKPIAGDTFHYDDIESDDDWDAKIEDVVATTRTRKTFSTNDTPALINCISYALSSRPVQDRSKYVENEDDKAGPADRRRISNEMKRNLDNRNIVEEKRKKWNHNGYYLDDQLYQSSVGNSADGVEDDDNIFWRVMSESIGAGGYSSSGIDAPNFASAPLLGKNEILQIKILYGGECVGKCSRVHKVNDEEQSNTSVQDVNMSDGQHRRQERLLRGLQQRVKEQIDIGEDREKSDGLSLSSPSYWEKVHYRYARDDALLHLDEKTISLHNITFVNVTLTERCLSTGSDDGELSILNAIGEFLSQVYGMDSIIINQLMYGIRAADGTFTNGYVKSLQTQERWGWNKEQLEAFEHNSLMDWATRKLGVLLLSTLAFFFITSITSLIVRVLTSSGVVLMFPLFTFFRTMGLPGADERILSLSYPWIGTARMAIANRHVHSQSHLIWAHCMKIVLYYVMYEACQAAWSVVLYAKSIPEALPIWIFGFAMIWEYFSMVFVRSALSVHFFPRLTLLYFFCYHVYFYSVPYGYFDVALIPLFFLMMHAMLYTVLGLEAPNAARGVINVECPREVYNRLSWQEPVAAIPAEWTMFLPLNSRVSSLHDRDVPNDTAINAG